jgi:hypothetical protein
LSAIPGAYPDSHSPAKPGTASDKGRFIQNDASEGIMERKRQLLNKADVRDDRGKVRLEGRYGEIGISAVAAAVQPHGNRRRKSAPDRGTAKQEEPKKR